MSEPLSQSIQKWSLANAQEFGSASAGKVLGKILAEHAECKKDVKGTLVLIEEECRRVNALSKEALAAELSTFHFDVKKEEDTEGGRKITLPGAVQGRVVTRFPPEPSGYLHIGHAKAAFLNYESAKQAGGYMRLRMDDTNPEKEKQEFVDAIQAGLKWLGISWQGDVTYTSDYMDTLYQYADELMLKNRAYVCTCPAAEVKKGREKGEECLCRAKFSEENVHDFRRMMGGKFQEGEAILRFRGNMKAENTVMRDPTLFRMIFAPHFRQNEKYKCWPSYDFAVPIIDSIEGITHSMRSKEYDLRDELYYSLLKILELRPVRMVSFSRLSIKGAPVSKRLITPLIAEGKVSGYDDPRLPTLAALKRRGIQPAAIREFVLSFGLTKVESEPGLDKLLSANRKLIDSTSPRRFFAADPALVEITGAPERILTVRNHPQNAELGTRTMQAAPLVFIPGADATQLADNETFRLKDWCNVRVRSRRDGTVPMPDGSSASHLILSVEFVSDEGEVAKKVQWVADRAKKAASVIVPGDLLDDNGTYRPESLQTVWGWAEDACSLMEIGQSMQFERFGFVTLDGKKDETLSFIRLSD